VTESYTLANAVVYSNSTNLGVTSANLSFNGTTFTTANDASISGLTVGKGNGSLNQNTVVGSGLGSTTGNANCAFGVASLRDNTTGNGGCSFGYASLVQNTTGISNSAYGYSSLFGNTTGGSNSAFGYQSLVNNTTASNNTAVGYQAGYAITTGPGNTFFGAQAGYSNTGSYNTMVGGFAGYNSTGSGNTFVGANSTTGNAAGYNMTTGSKNAIFGGFSGNQGSLDIRTASNYIVLSDGDGNPRGIFDNNGLFVIGTITNTYGSRLSVKSLNDNVAAEFYRQGTSAGSGIVVFNSNSGGTETLKSYIDVSTGALTVVSDERLKENIVDISYGLNQINALRPVSFEWKNSDGNLNLGFIAQEVEIVIPEAVTTLDESMSKTIPHQKMLNKDSIIPVLVKAIQELNAQVTTLQAQVTALQGK
jgi:hypothetical protein